MVNTFLQKNTDAQKSRRQTTFMADRHVIKIAVSTGAKQAVEGMCNRYGMTHQELASRMYEWLADQDQIVQASVLGLLPDSVEGQAADIYMERVKAKRAAGPKGSKARGPS